MKKIKFTIKSDLDNVSLVGMSVRKLCSLTPLSENQSFQIELCAVEAINNSIMHAYQGEMIYEVEIILSIQKDHLLLEIIDKGKAIDSEVLENASLSSFDEKIEVLEAISESGRGLGIIKEFMDKVSNWSDNDGNHLIMEKKF